VPFLETIKRQNLALNNLSIKVDGITKDNVKTSVNINVIYRVKDDDKSIIDSLFKNSNIVQTITSLIEEQLRARIFEFSHEEIFGKRSEIGEEIKETLRIKMAEFGMELDSVQVVDIQLDQRVIDAMNNVVASQKNKSAAITEAEGKKQAQILNAEGDREVKRLL
jgi:regulator of protease activity HflC (stomatin/prohibitin superfamily)